MSAGATHDHDTRSVKVADLDDTMTLVGECGGLSSILERDDEALATKGYVAIVTEHGTLRLWDYDEVEVLAP